MPIYLDQLQAVIGQRTGQRQGGFVPLPMQALQPQQQPQQQNFLQRFNVLPTVGAIGGAVGGSFLAPGAGTIAGGAGGAGLGELLEQILFNKGKFNVGGLAAETALGGLGGIAGRLLGAGRTAATAGRVAGEAGEELTKRGLAETVAAGARRSILKPPGKGPFFAAQQKDITDTLGRQGLRGSPQAIGEKIPGQMKLLSDQAKQLIQGAGVKPLGKSTLKNRLIAGADDIVEFNPADNLHATSLENEVNKLVLQTKGRFDNLFDYKLSLGKQLTNTFPKITQGGTLQSKEAAKYAIWKQIDDLITSEVPDAKFLTTEISNIISGSSGIQKAAETGVRIPVPFAGRVRLPDIIGRPIQAGVERGAGAIEGAGVEAAIPSALGRATRAIAGQLIPRALTGFGGTQAETGIPQPSELGAFGGGAISQPLGTEVTQQQPLITREQAFQLLLSGAEPSLVNALLKVGGPQEQNIPASIRTQLAGAQSAKVIIDQVAQGYASINAPESGLVARFTGFGRQAGALAGVNPQARAYQSLRAGAARRIIKALGEVGTLSASDIQAAVDLLPTVYDSQQEAALKLQNLYDLIGASEQALQNAAFMGGSPGIDTEAILQSLTGGV